MFTLRGNQARILVGIAITGILSCLMLAQFPPFEALEAKLLDLRFKVRGTVKPPDSIVIAAIDERSIEKLGRWPWDRSVLARIVDRLSQAEAAVVAFDIILSEHHPHDSQLATALQNSGNVVLPMVFAFNGEMVPPEDRAFTQSAFHDIRGQKHFADFPPIEAHKVLLPVPELRNQAMGLGHINMLPDKDGTLRWEALAILYADRLYPSLALQTAIAYLGIPPERLSVLAGQGIKAGSLFIPTDRWGRTLINYYGPGQTFQHVSIADILDGSVPPDLLRDRIVLIGATAVGIYDLRVTPLAAAMPGVEKHASVIASILDRRFIRATGTSANQAILWCSGILFTLLVARFRLVGDVLITGLGLTLFAAAGYLAFTRSGIWFNLAYPSNNLICIFIGITAYNYAVEERYARKIKGMFSSYVTQTIVNELIKNPDMARLGGERREVTVLFSDIKDFTTLSEHHTPEEVVALLNEYLTAMTDVILFWEGTLDKFIGDAIVVFWNAPVRTERHAELALRCALAMQDRLEELRKKWAEEGKPLLESGIGINTGEVVVGNIGAEGKKMEYTVIGDQVNLGSRIESQTRKLEVPILITDGTLARLHPPIDAGTLKGVMIEGLASVIVKGRETPVELYGVSPLPEPDLPAMVIPCPEMEPVRLTEK